MAILQLDPMIPVYVEGLGTGMAFALIDYSQEHFLLFAIALDDGGDIWLLDNREVKFQTNASVGRTAKIRPINDSAGGTD